MKVEIDLADLGVQMDEDGQIVDRVEIVDLAIKAVTDRIYSEVSKDIKTGIAQLVQKTAEEEVARMVTDALRDPVQETTRWGEPLGEKVTIRELIRRQIEKYLSLGPSQRDPYGSRDDKPKSLQDLIAKETRDVMNGELAVAVNNAKTEVVHKVSKAVLDAAQERLARR